VTLRSPITNVDHYLLPFIAVVIVASLIPTGVGLLRNRPVHRRVRRTPVGRIRAVSSRRPGFGPRHTIAKPFLAHFTAFLGAVFLGYCAPGPAGADGNSAPQACGRARP
jgi:hypothetical protein